MYVEVLMMVYLMLSYGDWITTKQLKGTGYFRWFHISITKYEYTQR